MPKLKEFIKNNYVLCTVFAVIFIVCLSSLIIIHLINTFRPHVDVRNEEGAYFQVLGKEKYSFDASIRKENEVNKEISPKDYKLVDLSPIYYSDKKQLILTNDSGIVLYMRGFVTFKLPKYSELIDSDENKSVIVNGSRILANDSFVYDGVGNYIVFDNVTLKYNGKSIKLSPLSFINVSASGLTYYDYQNDTIVDDKSDIKNAFLIYDTFNIDLIKNVIIKNGKVTIIKNNVNSFGEYKED